MEKKIKINVKEEKILRLSIPSENGTIVINNPTEGFKKELLSMIVTCITEKKDFDEKKVMLDIINHCTNVEFEGDIFEAEYLTHEAKMITNEVLIIFQEITEEAYQVIKLAMQQTKNEMIQKEILNEKDEIIDTIEKIKDKKEEEVKEVSHKTVKKPQRSRGKVSRK